MKKILIVLFTLLMLCGCSFVEKETALEFDKVVEDANLKFEYEYATCRASLSKAEYITLNYGEKILVEYEDENFAYFDYYGLGLALDKQLIKNASDEQFESYTGYTRKDAYIYSDFELTDRLYCFKLNDEVIVLDEIGNLVFVQDGDTYGYMYASQVSKKKIVNVVKKVEETPAASSGGGGGGSSYSPPADAEAPGDGQAIGIAYYPTFESYVFTEGFESYEAIVRGNVSAYITFLNRDDLISVLEENEDYASILVDGHIATLKRGYVLMAEDERFETFNGYTVAGAISYLDYNQSKQANKYNRNDRVNVVDMIYDTYVIQLEDGTYEYIDTSKVAKNKIIIKVVEKVEETPVSSGGGGGGGSPAPAIDDWGPAMF